MRSPQDYETTVRDHDCVADRASVHRPLILGFDFEYTSSKKESDSVR